MPKYSPSDDGKVIGGKTIVFLYPSGEGPSAAAQTGLTASGGASSAKAGGSPKPGPQKPGREKPAAQKLSPAQKEEVAGAQAASLTSAAKDGKPFCEECERARQELRAKAGKK